MAKKIKRKKRTNPETKLQAKIIKSLRALPGSWWIRVNSGLLRIANRFIHLAPAGTPDIIGIMYGKMCAFEVKTEDGEATADQERTIDLLLHLGAVAGVVRSFDDCLALLREARVIS